MKKLIPLIAMLIICVLFSDSEYARGVTVTPTTDASTLANIIVGSGITIVGTPAYIGVTNQSATFTSAAASGLGFDSGILMTSGLVDQVFTLNDTSTETLSSFLIDAADNLSNNLSTAGDADLTTLSGYSTYDADILSFNFQFGDGTVGGDLFVNFVFASEEYLNWVNSGFNDVFGFFVDGTNIALVPTTTNPVAVNTINPTSNSSLYRNNVNNTNGYPNLGLGISYDGLTTLLNASETGLGPGVHTMKFAIADASDHILDAGVFIQQGTFSSQQTAIPEPSTLFLVGVGLAGVGALRKKFRKQ